MANWSAPCLLILETVRHFSSRRAFEPRASSVQSCNTSATWNGPDCTGNQRSFSYLTCVAENSSSRSVRFRHSRPHSVLHPAVLSRLGQPLVSPFHSADSGASHRTNEKSNPPGPHPDPNISCSDENCSNALIPNRNALHSPQLSL